MSEIDGRAEVSSSARIARNVKIGPFAVVAGEVELGEN
jgi:acyl-[acyl carrier protein]--UDP-N-acetylglucosamine O-acyltransferase